MRSRDSAAGFGTSPAGLFLLVFLVQMMGAVTPVSAQDRVEPEVVEITFARLATYSEGELTRAILTEATSCRTFAFVFPLPAYGLGIRTQPKVSHRK